MKASKLDLMKLALTFDGEFNIADFSPDEIDEMLGYMDQGLSVDELREKYFEFYDDVKDRTQEKHKWSD
jgi:hypothetical protein